MSRDVLPAPVDWPGGRRRRRRRRSHRSHRSHRAPSRRSSARAPREAAGERPALASDVLTDERPEVERRAPSHRGRRRGLVRRFRRWRRRGRYRRYTEFMGRGSSPRAIAKRYAQQSRRKRRLVLAALILLGGGLLAGVAADAYLQTYRVLDLVRDSGESLKQVRSNLIRGKLPPETAFADAAKSINQAEAAVDGARVTWKAMRPLPFVGLPVKATEHLLEASRHELAAAIEAKKLLEAVLGTTLDEARAQQEAAAAERERAAAADKDGDGKLSREERKALRGGQAPGGGRQEEAEDPNALLNDGVVNLKAVRELVPGVSRLKEELTAAERAVTSIGSVPFVSKAEELKLDLIEEIRESRILSERALAGLNFIPGFLGGGGTKNYLLLFCDSGYLRGTGGAYFAYAEFTVKSGRLELVNQGPIIDIDKYRNEPVEIPKDNWYLQPETAISKVAVRMNNLNWDPHFPNTAVVAKRIYQRFYPESKIDGVFQIDITGVSYLVDAIGPIDVESWDGPIGGGNLERIALIDSYVEFSEGGDDASDSGQERKAFNEDLVNATWRSLQDPKDLVRTVFQLSRALSERHMQVWVEGKKQQAFFEELGWAGAVKTEPGDYVYVVDQNLGDDTLDAFTSERVDYDVVVNEEGDLDVTATVRETNFVDATLPYPIIDNEGPPVKKTYVNLYAPANAQLESVTYRERITGERPAHTLPPRRSAGRVVFSAKLSVRPQETASVTFRYTVPGGLLDEDGPVYRLTIQRQPRYVDQSVRVRVTFPEGWDAKFPADEWEFSGNRATYFIEALEQDRVVELRF